MTARRIAEVEPTLALIDVILDERDAYTREHCNRIVSLAERVGKLCRLEGSSLALLKVSAFLHDVGKIGIPDAVLLKPGPLDDEEWEIMKSHSEKGERILRGSHLNSGGQIGNIVRHHHESFDGSGYPDGISGEAIPVQSRIIAVVDSYDAMTTRRAYSQPRSHEEAISILHDEEGEKNDPYVLRKFLHVLANCGMN